MNAITPAAVIFDVDGPLLDLTPPEEAMFFEPLRELHDLRDLSADWNSYRIRNDVEIYREILETHFNRPPSQDELDAVIARYLELLEQGLNADALEVAPVPGARDLLESLSRIQGVLLGVATANLGGAARLRLSKTDMWRYVQDYPGAAEYGGPKRDILARVMQDVGAPPERVVFLGDNLNDLDAGRTTGAHFIGFHWLAERRERLRAAGARLISGDHETSFAMISELLDLPAGDNA